MLSNMAATVNGKHSNPILMDRIRRMAAEHFKITEGFVEKIWQGAWCAIRPSESAIVGAALGLSLEGYGC